MRIYLFALLLLSGMAACKRDDERAIPASYHIEGIADRELIKGSHTSRATPSFQLSVVDDQSAQEQVTLSLEQVPAGLYYRILPPAGKAPYSVTFAFADSGVALGSYPLRLVATGATTGRHEFGFTMDVRLADDCTADLIGRNFVTSSHCLPSSNYLQNITATSVHNRILFNDFDHNGLQLYADIDCDLQALFMPAQVINGISYSGSGAYTINRSQRIVTIDLVATKPSGETSTCNYKLVQ